MMMTMMMIMTCNVAQILQCKYFGPLTFSVMAAAPSNGPAGESGNPVVPFLVGSQDEDRVNQLSRNYNI